MIFRGGRAFRILAVVAVMGVVTAFAGFDLLRRWRSIGIEEVFWSSSRAPDRGDLPMAGRDGDDGGGRRLPTLPILADDPRLASLRRAAESWRPALDRRRDVVDQVCLVPDIPSFFEAIAAWDDRHYFPILIDEPEWTLPFLRAFRPARVVRYISRRGPGAGMENRMDPSGFRASSTGVETWLAATEAVSRGWTAPTAPGEELPPAGAPPRGVGETTPGLVLSSPESPMLAGAVALAAGRFQPLIRVEPSLWGLGGPGVRYGDVLTLSQAWRFAEHLEARVAGVIPRYGGLGDDCDFLTIAGDWPYRYDDRVEGGPARGLHALDDLIGRTLVGGPDARGLNASRRRWAYTGRLLGGPAASLARAMASLFLAPDLALFWDTYESNSPRSDYTTIPAAHLLGRFGAAGGGVYQAGGAGADLASWDRIMDPWNRFGLVWINSTGSPTDFSIGGGPGRPADVPGGRPSAVVMIHSFSAADPADPATIAGRWLAQGAYVYFGSMNEPYLQAFRKPGLVADLLVRGIPLSAALRQGEFEPLGRPWRLVYLGDPLHRLPVSDRSRRAGPDGIRADRVSPENWRGLAADHAGWPAPEVIMPRERPADDDGGWLIWCREAAAAELAVGPRVARALGGGIVMSVGAPDSAWPAALARIRRDRLDPGLRPIFDDLVVDALSRSGEWDELHARLSQIPPTERRPRAWAALESGAIFRLARAARDADRDRGRARARELLDEVSRSPWPAGSSFRAQFAERASAVLR